MSDETHAGDVRRDGASVDGDGVHAPESAAEPSGSGPARYDHGTTVIARTVVRTVVPIITLTAIGLLFQGHNRPGGGFIGAVLTATAFVLVYVVFGMEFLRNDLLGLPAADSPATTVEYYRWLFSGGLALAALSGLAPLLVGLPFLSQAVLFLEGVPLYGEFEVASAFAFDLGVYLTVVGGLLTVLGEVGAE